MQFLFQFIRILSSEFGGGKRKYRNMFEKKDLEKYRDIISEVLKISEKVGVKTYIVGGLIRDIILKIETTDIDFVVEGDVYALSMEALKSFQGRNFKYMKEFGTASFDFIKDKNEYRIDFARARKEEYPIPGEHPKVYFVDDVKIDLFRRDFTINAIAMEINQELNFRIIDVVNGLKDISERKIRVLHKMSIADDPTRILRCVRISLKTGFLIDDSVLESLEIAKKTGSFRRVHGSRFFSEFKIAAKENFFEDFLRKLKELNVLVSIHPALDISVEEFPNHWQEKIAKLISLISNESRYDVINFFGVPKGVLKKLEKFSRV